MPPGKYLAGGLQSGCTANSTGVQYKCVHEYKFRKAGMHMNNTETHTETIPPPKGIYNPLLWKNIQNKFKSNTAIEQTFCYNKTMKPVEA